MPDEQQKWRSEVVDTDDRFFVLREQWQSLQKSLSDPHSSPFLSWDWLYLWWSIYRRPSWKLSIGLVWRDEQLVAILPFYVQRSGLQQLYFLGTGEAESEEVATEYLDCLLLNDCDVQRHVEQCLTELLCRIDVIVFQRMLKSATLFTLLSVRSDFPVVCEIELGCRYSLDLRNPDYAKQFGSNLKRKYRNFQNNSAAEQWKSERCDTAQQLDVYLAELKRLHELRWHSKGKPGAFASPRFLAFHRRFAEMMLQQGQLYLALLTIENTIVGCLYSVDGSNTRYFYQAGFLPAMQHWAPGHLAHFLAITDAVARGYSQYDFMLGVEMGSYKREYTPPGEKVISLVATRSNVKMLMYRLFNKFLSYWS